MNNHTLTPEQYEELFKEVMLFAKIGGIVEEDVIWGMCLEEMKELRDALLIERSTEILDAVGDCFVTLAQLHNYHFEKTHPQTIPNIINPPIGFSLSLRLLESRNKHFPKGCMAVWMRYANVESENYKFNLYKVIKEVNRSNFTKYPLLEDVLGEYDSLELAAAYCEKLGKVKGKNYPNVVAIVNTVDGVDYVVFRQDNGKSKVVKHFDFFQEPNFEDCY